MMETWHFSRENIKALITVVILIVAVYSFVREKIAPDVTALLVMITLLLTTVLTPTEAFSGFSHPATVSVAAVLVLSAAIERTGALSFVARRLLAPLGKSEFLLTIAVMLVIGIFSAFINNTAAVAIFIPIVLEVCRRTGASPGRVLMPMAHAATLGGMCTLIGTSTNLVAHEFARKQGLPGFSMFELGQVGLPIALAGCAYMLLIGRLFLPRTEHSEVADVVEGDKRYLTEYIVAADSPWIGRKISAEALERDFEVELVGVTRRDESLNLSAESEGIEFSYEEGDSLRVNGNLDHILELSAEVHRPEVSEDISLSDAGAKLPNGAEKLDATSQEEAEKATPNEALALAEIVVLTTSGLIGRTLKGARFAEKYNAVVLALRRRGVLTERPSMAPLHAGDVLVVEGQTSALQELAQTRGFLVISTRENPAVRPRRLLLTLMTLLSVVTIAALGWLPIVTAAVAGCAVLMLTGSLRPREAYQAIDLSLVFLLAGSLALGSALEKTGITQVLARFLSGMSGVTGPYLVMAGFFLTAVLISEFMSNSGTTALLGPLALSVSQQMGINPLTLLVAVTFGSSAAFAMPIGYQTSMMIYGPGGYRMRDFIKMGIVLDLLLTAIALWLIPRYWPF
jgi:di/tricarboxylate transporter